MAEKVRTVIKLQIAAGKANTSHTVGPGLGQHGIYIIAFCKEYNERTASQVGFIIPVELTVFDDRSFTFITKTPPTTDLLRKAVGVEKGASASGHEKAGVLSRDKLREIAQLKAKDLTATTIEGTERIIEGTARSMGIEIE